MRTFWQSNKVYILMVVALGFLGIVLLAVGKPSGRDKGNIMDFAVVQLEVSEDGTRLWANETDSVVVPSEKIEQEGIVVGDTVRICTWRHGEWFNKWHIYVTEVRKLV